ncbi:MAG: hypothetical protein U5R31_15335 [Acidimicrobiia bacterium]|nr:hypothetical protein [Acidimicrobiia bacterium]
MCVSHDMARHMRTSPEQLLPLFRSRIQVATLASGTVGNGVSPQPPRTPSHRPGRVEPTSPPNCLCPEGKCVTMVLMPQGAGSDDSELATKAFVRTEIVGVRTEIAELRTEVRTGLADVRTEMHLEFRRMTLALSTVLAGALVGGMGLAAAVG